MRVVLASGNQGKLRELEALLAPLEIDLESQNALGVPPAAETGLTFVENALIKARNAAHHTSLAAIGDDSGLVVPSLGGAPGLYSSRYAGAGATDADNNAKLQAALRGTTDRRAFFYCALVFLAAEDDPAPLIATGRWWGTIVDSPRGENGFGYDPFFEVESLGSTAAELDAHVKNAASHRGQAARHLLELLRERS